MAPVQARGVAPSPEADWYSVGVLLYQALTGYKPFTGSPREVLALKCRVEPVLPAQRVAGLPEDLGRLCEELLRMDPRQRPSGEQVLRRLGVEQEASEEVWSTLALPFMSRRAELAALHQALEESRRGGSVAVRVEGESGVGKSRLVRRFVEEVTARWPGAVVLAGRCYERESVPYKGVDGLVDALARHLSGQGRDKAWSVLGQESHPLVRLFPVLGKVEPLALSHLHPVPADPMQVRLAAFVALREVLQAPGLLLVATVRVTTLLEPVGYARAAASLRGARLAFTTGPAATDTLEVLHDKVRQAVGPYLEPLARRGWHTRLASSLETLGQGGVETLARHWLEAGQPARAADYYVQAAREASAVLAFSRAASLSQRALGMREWEEVDARRMERLGLPLSAALACSLRAAVADLRGRPEAVELYERAEQALEAAGAPLYAMGQRIRRGRLLGGEQGRLLVASGRGWMEQQGARNLDMAEVVLTSGVPPR